MTNPVQSLCEPTPVDIANGASLSTAVNLSGRILCGIYMPAAWTAGGLSFQASEDGLTFYDVWVDGAEYTTATAAGVYTAINSDAFLGVRHIKVRAGTSAVPVAQGALRTLLLMAGVPDVG